MQAYLTLVRRELGGFFVSLTGYVIIASVLLLLGISFTGILGVLNDSPTDVPLTELFYKSYYFWSFSWSLRRSSPCGRSRMKKGAALTKPS